VNFRRINERSVIVGILVLPLVALCVGWTTSILTGSFGFMFFAFIGLLSVSIRAWAVLVFLGVRRAARRFANRIAKPS
jgi:hypothetical protein